MHQLLLFLTLITLSLLFTIGKSNSRASKDLARFSEVNAEIFGDNVFDFQDSNTSTLISVNPDITQILSVISIQTSSIAISPDGKTLILYDTDLQGFQVYDVSDPEFPTLLSSFTLDFTFSINLATLVFSPDGKTGFITCNDWIGTEYLMAMDLTNPASPVEIVLQPLYKNLKADLFIQNSGSLIISPDGQTVFAWNCVTTLYEPVGSILAIIDVSNITNPKEISQFLYSGGTCSSLSTTSIVLQGDKLFYNDGLSLLVLDVSNLTNPILENTINLSTNASVGLAVSADGKNAFTVSEDFTAEPSEVTKLQIVNMINPSATINITLGFFPAASLSQALTLSSNNDFLFVAGFDLMFINITDMQNITYGAVNTISNPNIITLSPDGRTAFVANNFEVAIIKLYLDVQMNQVFSLPADSNMQLILFPTNDTTDDVVQTMTMSSDNNIAFLLLWSGNLQIFDISNLSSPKLLGMISGLNLRDYISIVLSPDDQTAFVTCDDELLIIDISNPASPSILNTYSPEEGGSIVHFDISPDGKVGFLTQQHNLTTINISHPESLVNIEILEIKNILTALSFGLSKDGNLGFVLIQNISSQANSLLSLDTSNVSSLSEINLLSLTSSNNLSNKKTTIAGESNIHISISPDNEAVFTTLDINGVDLQVCDFSSLASPTQIFWSASISPILPVIFSQDSTTAFICTSTEFLVVNISPLETPTILRSYPASNVVSIMLSQDESIAYLSIQNGTLLVINLKPEYVLDIRESNYELGGVYSNPIVPLQLNEGNKYNVLNQDLSFLEVSFYNIETLPGTGQTIITYPPLPSWISFEQDQGILTISPVSAFQMGYYQIYGALSTIISSDVFIGLGNITNLTQSQDLFATLISLGYISPQGFLTSNFDSSAKLVLFSQYSDLESDIHKILLDYYIEITTTVSVSSSLSLMLSKELMVVNTKSQNTLSLVIQVNSSIAQFVSANYAAVTMVSNNDSTISMEGSLANINLALGQIILNLNDGVTECDGSVAIFDGLNPSANQSIANISQYFILNQAPVLNPDISIQDQMSSIYTGEEFYVDLTGVFLDSNGQGLEYSLSMKDDNGQVPEWLMIRGQTLGGTPPKRIFHSEIDLVIIAKNQFKSSSIPVTLKIRVSVVYGLELVGTYGGALITIIGLYIYINTIYNIMCKKRYRYPKDFVIKVGDERSVHSICCIGFIGKEVRASKAIMQEIRKTVAREINVKSVSKEKFLGYFVDPISDSLMEEKLIQMATRELLNLEEKNKFHHDKHSPIKGHLRKEVIQQLVINEVLAVQVDLEKERITRNVFKVLRNDWVHLVERTSDPLQYKLNRKELKKRMMKIRIIGYNSKENRDSNENLMLNPQLSTSDDFITMDKNTSKEIVMAPLVQSNQMKARGYDNINFDLLERLLIDVAFRYHNHDVDAINTKVIINQKPWELTSWTRFKGLFKKDLLQVEFAPRGETGYGISYEVRNGVLRFNGAPEKELKDTTLVIQITNKRGRILRELWINCIADERDRTA